MDGGMGFALSEFGESARGRARMFRGCGTDRWGRNDRDLLPAELRSAAKCRECSTVPLGGRGRSGGVPRLPSLPSVPGRRGALYRWRRTCSSWYPTDLGRRSRRPDGSGFGSTPRRLASAFAAVVRGRGWSYARRTGPVGAHALRATSLGRHRPLNHRDRVRGGLHEFATVQSRLPRDLPCLAETTPRASPQAGQTGRRWRVTLRLPFHYQLDWDATLAHLTPRAIPGVAHVANRVYRRTIVSRGNPGVLELMSGGDDDDHLLLIAHLPHWNDLMEVVQRARRIANLDFPLEKAVSALKDDSILGPLVEARPGVRPPGAWDPFESALFELVASQMAPKKLRRSSARSLSAAASVCPASSSSVSVTRSRRRRLWLPPTSKGSGSVAGHRKRFTRSAAGRKRQHQP